MQYTLYVQGSYSSLNWLPIVHTAAMHGTHMHVNLSSKHGTLGVKCGELANIILKKKWLKFNLKDPKFKIF